MKEVIIIVMILVSIITLGSLTQNHLRKTSEELNIKLEELRSELEYLISNSTKDKSLEYNEKAKQVGEDISNKWEELNKTWSIIVSHTELDQIQLSILEVKSCVEIGDLETGREELEKTIFLVNHVKEKEALKLKNIL